MSTIGFWPDSGSIGSTVYVCPCSEVEVRRAKDDIPGFCVWFIDGEAYRKKYTVDNKGNFESWKDVAD